MEAVKINRYSEHSSEFYDKQKENKLKCFEVIKIYQEQRGDIKSTSKILGISNSTIRRMMDKVDFNFIEFRKKIKLENKEKHKYITNLVKRFN